MSGGHFDYKCFSISQFADELRNAIDENSKEDDCGYARNFSSKTIETLEECQLLIAKAGKVAKEIEWFYSGDIGEETFLERMKDLK